MSLKHKKETSDILKKQYFKYGLGFAALMAIFLASNVAHASEEEPKFEIVSKDNHIEIRRYAPIIIAQTEVEGDLSSASGKGFRLITDYIFGNNTSADKTSNKIAMTVPVTMESVDLKKVSEKIAMTVPVTMERENKEIEKWKMHFVMPSKYTIDTLPKPNNSAVVIRELPSKQFAVLNYSGFNTENNIKDKTAELYSWLNNKNIVTIGNPQLARYNRPWTLPMLRRNEIMIEIKG